MSLGLGVAAVWGCWGSQGKLLEERRRRGQGHSAVHSPVGSQDTAARVRRHKYWEPHTV